jgi:AraC-like DNA-binding protein
VHPRTGDVASALLVRLTRQELARRGLIEAVADDRPTPAATRAASGSGRTPDPFGRTLGEATVALAPKRALLAAAAERAGLVPLLEVGRGLDALRRELPDDPVLAALLAAADPVDAVRRWQRLERCVHSRHRLELLDVPPSPAPPGAGGGTLLVRHVGPPGAPPTAAEDALILGVLAVLCRHAGATGLTVWLVAPGGPTHAILDADVFAEPPAAWPVAPGATGTWRFAWRGVTAAAAHPARVPRAAGGPHAADDARSPLVAQLAAVVAADLGRTWTLAAAARALAVARGPSLAPRTLQRRLAEAGATFPGVVRSARVAAAGRLLAETRVAPGVVAFACGFADQPHLTRQFKRQTGLTPAAYRRAFGPAPPGRRPPRAAIGSAGPG